MLIVCSIIRFLKENGLCFVSLLLSGLCKETIKTVSKMIMMMIMMIILIVTNLNLMFIGPCIIAIVDE